MNIPDIKNLLPQQLRAKSLEKNYPEFVEFIVQKYKLSNIKEMMYLHFNNLNEQPMCPTCGKKIKFDGHKYPGHCSRTCMQRDPTIQAKKNSTLNKNFGDDGLKNELVKNKRKQTCLEKYGVESPNSSDIVKKRKEETCIEKFGTLTPFHSKEIQQKAKNTIKLKYGVNNIKQTHILFDYPEVISISGNTYVCKCQDDKCNMCEEKTFEITNTNLYNRKHIEHCDLCTKRNPIGSINQNTGIEQFIRNILDECGIEYQTNVRDIITPKELDIYIPEKKLAIECNGCYWHSSSVKNKDYHLEKYRECKEKGIHLISIWEDWIINTPSKVRAIILSKMGVYEQRIGARECIVKIVTSNECNNFLNKYHLQNNTNSSIKIGLYYKKELVSIMTFGKRKLFGNDDWELIRYCCKSGMQIIGGANKLMKYFIQNYNPKRILSFFSNDISNGDLYRKLGFKIQSTSNSYWYIDNKMTRYHRSNFTKQKLIRDGFDKEKTEEQIMAKRGYMKIYDSGQTKCVLEL